MSIPHMPRVEAGERGDRINIGGGVYWRRYTTAGSTPLFELMGPDGGFVDANSATEEEARAFAAALNPAPAPQDTAEAMAEVERLVERFGNACRYTAVTFSVAKPGDQRASDAALNEEICRHPLLAAVRAMADRVTTAEAARDEVAAYAQRLQIALTGAAGGGSENFVQHGDGFRADIPFCVTKINQRFHDTMDSLKAEIRARKAAEAALASLRAEREVPGELVALSEKATGGEWRWREGDAEITCEWNGKPRPIAAVIRPAWHEDFISGGREAGDNADLIVAAVGFVRTLISAQKELRHG